MIMLEMYKYVYPIIEGCMYIEKNHEILFMYWHCFDTRDNPAVATLDNNFVYFASFWQYVFPFSTFH